MSDPEKQCRAPEPIDRSRLITSTAMTLLILTLPLFVPAGTWAWARGWRFLAVLVVAGVVLGLYLRRSNPEVIAARVNRHEGTKPWDRWVVGLLLVLMVSIIPIAALDDGRYRWSDAPWWACGFGYVLLLAGVAGMAWAEQGAEGLGEVAGADALQVEPGDQLLQAPGPLQVRRQDRRGELLPLHGGPAVVDPGLLDLDVA